MTFGEPRFLLLLILLPVLATAAVIMARVKAKQWTAFMADRMRKHLLSRRSPLSRWVAFTCLILGMAMIIIAMARPQDQKGTKEETLMGRNILIALDLSRSMKVRDVKPSRLDQAKATCYELLEELPNDRFGLIGFAGTSYLFAPLTVDHGAVRETIAQLDTDWLPRGGSSLESGLEMAIETLDKTGTQQNALIIMTDGDETVGSVADLAQEASEAGIEVITIGFGTTEGDFVPDPSRADGRFRDRQGKEVISRLETRPLERLAAITGGRFAIAASGADIPAMVEAAAADLDRVQMKGLERTVMVEYYQWFLLPGILLLIASVVAATRWRSFGSSGQVTALIAFGFLLIPVQPLKAQSYDKAMESMEAGRHEEAASEFGALANRFKDTEKGYRYRLAEGTAAYRAGDMATARSAFSQALRSKDSEVVRAAHHGMGNTLFQIGWQRLSDGKNYPETLPEEEPGDEEDSDNPFKRLSDALLDTPEDDEVDEIDMGDFEKMVKKRLEEWLSEKGDPDDEDSDKVYESRGSARFNDLLTDWIDSVKHFDGAKDFEDSAHNRELTVKHLKKLREIMENLEDNAQQIQAIPSPGEGEPQEGMPQPGEGEPQEGDQEQEGEGGDSDRENDQEGGDGDQEQENQDGEGDQQDGESEASDEEPGDKEPKPGETPEDAARRILEENADLQKGAIRSGRLEFREPEKDW